MDAKRAWEMMNDALRAAGINQQARYLDEWYEDEECRGYVEVDGVILYPHKFDDGDIGWGVAAEVTIPGCHTMPNGDPGYPDESDVVDLALPYEDIKTIAGTRRVRRSCGNAIQRAVLALVQDRLNNWVYYPVEVE